MNANNESDLRELRAVKQAVRAQLVARLGETDASGRETRASVSEALEAALNDHAVDPAAREQVRAELLDLLTGLGPLESLLNDDAVTEIMVNHHDCVFVERNGQVYQTDVRFDCEDDYRLVLRRLAASVNKNLTPMNPYIDGYLEDGSRFNIAGPPMTVDSPALTIRRFQPVMFSLDELAAHGMMEAEQRRLLENFVEQRRNLVISGRTSTGKTTLLNALSAIIPSRDRVITIEDTAELQIQGPHVVRLQSRTWHTEQEAAISIRDVVRNALRMRPDRILIGECRGGEALDMLQAMNTGHDGSMATVHANSAADALARVETMALMGGIDLPSLAVRQQIARAIYAVIHLERGQDGSRFMDHIALIRGLSSEGFDLQTLYQR